MLTSFDKALVAVVVGGLSMLSHTGALGISPDIIAWIVSVIGPLAVWAVPNK